MSKKVAPANLVTVSIICRTALVSKNIKPPYISSAKIKFYFSGNVTLNLIGAGRIRWQGSHLSYISSSSSLVSSSVSHGSASFSKLKSLSVEGCEKLR